MPKQPQSQNKQKPKQKKDFAESALKLALNKKIQIFFVDGTSIFGTLNFVNKYDYVLKDAYRYVKTKTESRAKKEFTNNVIILKSAVKYIVILDEQ